MREKFHLLYTDKDNKFCNEEKYFSSITACENWLKSIKAKHWEIGFLDRDVKSALEEAIKS